MSAYLFWMNASIPVEHIAVGNTLGGLLGAEPGDSAIFSNGSLLKNTSDVSNTPVRVAIALSVKGNIKTCVDEFNSEGPYTELNLLGVTNETVGVLKSLGFVVEVGDRALLEDQVTTYWASLGYEAIPKTLNFP